MPLKRPSRILPRVLGLAGWAVVALATLEVLARLVFGAPLFVWHDWRTYNVRNLHPSAVYHPLLGWQQKPNVTSPNLNTLANGVRKNSNRDEIEDQGAILVVGDSFAAGAEVLDDQTWPAHLERQTGLRVLNAGVGGFGVDQTVLNAEHLLPLLKPKLVVVGILVDDIARSRYRVRIEPKPYFSPENGGWELRNVPVPRQPKPAREATFKALLAHSFAVHRFMIKREALRDAWYSSSGLSFDVAHDDGAGASCHALGRLAKQLAAAGARSLIVMQYEGSHYASGAKRPVEVEAVLACARTQGYGIIDEFDALSAVARQSVERLKTYYMMRAKWSFGHMSPAGNAAVGALIAEHLKAAPALTDGVTRVR